MPAILILPMCWGLKGILYAQPVSDVLSAVITVVMAVGVHGELGLGKKKGEKKQ